ncbi:RNA-directed DNA polymerase [Phytophthora megakarya]|uniref:RNA-directed DNA polymerase n=1 Tax=Phytophthora megakarya TaxID=4795 RepID=A0A225W777_9STRA|nr:RNA-directed DNA polymerase [Phytophthora megakarya]
MGDTYGSTKYVLVLKDEMTHFCELVPADSAGSEVVVAAILEWFKRFGIPESWDSYNGSHFKAEVMAQLSERLKANQSFVPVYTPWTNGPVERINRDILQVLRTILLEFQLDTRNWPYLLP